MRDFEFQGERFHIHIEDDTYFICWKNHIFIKFKDGKIIFQKAVDSQWQHILDLSFLITTKIITGEIRP